MKLLRSVNWRHHVVNNRDTKLCRMRVCCWTEYTCNKVTAAIGGVSL